MNAKIMIGSYFSHHIHHPECGGDGAAVFILDPVDVQIIVHVFDSLRGDDPGLAAAWRFQSKKKHDPRSKRAASRSQRPGN
jgi:hypothetical protein